MMRAVQVMEVAFRMFLILYRTPDIVIFLTSPLHSLCTDIFQRSPLLLVFGTSMGDTIP